MNQVQRKPVATESPPQSRKRRWLLLSLLVLLFFGWLFWPNGRLAKAKELQDELFSEASQSLSPEDRREKFGQLRNLTGQLSEKQRQELSQHSMKRRQEELERYTQLPPAEKRQRLDRDIDRQEQMRQRMQQGNGGTGGPPRSGGNGPSGGGQGRPSTPDDRERRRQQRLDHTTPEYRELTDQYRRDLEARRRERGLPPTPSRPPR